MRAALDMLIAVLVGVLIGEVLIVAFFVALAVWG